MYAIGVTFKVQEFRTAPGIPQSDDLIPARAEYPASVGRKCHRVDQPCVAIKGSDDALRGNVPETHHVFAGRHNPASVGRKRDRRNTVFMRPKETDLGKSGLSVPHSGRSIISSGYNPSPIC